MTAAFLAGAILLARPSGAGPALIPVENGSFEEAEKGSNFPAGWSAKRKEDIELSSDAMHGLKSVHVKCPWGWANTNLNVSLKRLPEGELISIGWWVKLNEVKKGDWESGACRLFIKFKTNDWKESTEEIAKFEGTAGWKWMTKKKIQLPSNLMEATLTLSFDEAMRGELWLDRIVVVRGSELPPETISTSDEVGTAADVAKVAIGRARAAARKKAVEMSAAEALADARTRVSAVTLVADELEAEARALAGKAEAKSNLLERAADLERAVAVVRAKVAAAISLINEGEAAQRREPTPAKAEEASAPKAAEALKALREAAEAADLAEAAMTDAVILVGTRGGGVYRDAEEGKWEARNADAPLPYASFIVAGPDGRLYCGGDEATLLDSDDNGKTWSATPTRLPAPATGFALDPRDAAHWIMTTWGKGVWTSADEGRNWTAAPAPSKFMRTARILRAGTAGASRVYSIADDTTIVRSDEIGGEWREIARMPRGIKAWDLAMKPVSAPVLIAATDAGIAEIADDGRISFPRLEVSTGWARALAVDADRVLIGTFGHGIVEWRPETTESPKARIINGGLGNTSVSALAASRHPKSEAAAGAEAEVGPRVWTDRSAGLTGGYVNGVAFNPEKEKSVYCTTKSGFYRSDDGGATWVISGTGLVGQNLGHIAVDPKSPDNIYVTPAYINNPAGIQKSTDGGKTWSQKNNGVTALTAMWIDLDKNTPSTAIAVTWGGGVFITWDSAETWYKLSAGMNQQNGYTVTLGAASPAAQLAGMAGALYRLSSDWKRWEPSGKGIPGQDIWSLAQDPNDGNVWLAGTAGGGLYKSADGGRSWRRIAKGLDSQDIYRVVYHPKKAGVVYIGTKNSSTGRGGNGVYRSVDGGETWASDNTGLTALGIEDLAITSKGLIYAATQNGIFYKQD